ncbi:MAG: hypothetical protein JXN60_00685 [Lentisphaerae bacterium]|nr:hypothetical protein [Lentisphaerota bacterium]
MSQALIVLAHKGLTPALCGHASALTGRTTLKLSPKPLWRASMLKLRRAGMVSTNALFGVPADGSPLIA